MPNRLFLHSVSAALISFGILTLPSSAFAGFEWVTPSESAPASVNAPSVQTWPVPSVSQAPLTATSAPEVISPVIIGGNAPAPLITKPTIMPPASGVAASGATANVTAPAPVIGGAKPGDTVVLAPVAAAPTTLSTSRVASSAMSPPLSTDVVHGFAKQVPLAVALRQILPPGYGFSVDPDVDLGVLISFQGGNPWRDTLRDALAPAGLIMREQGQMVSVGHGMATEAASVAPLPAPRMVDLPPAAPMPAAAPALAEIKSPVVEIWHAERDTTLHKIIQDWCARAQVELNWIAEYDYPIQASFSYSGTFEDAVRNLLTGFENAHPQPVAELHNNPALGLKVLVVQTRGNSSGD